MKTVDPAEDDGEGMPPMGNVTEVQNSLSRYNIAPDGASRKDGLGNTFMLYGPGMFVEIFAEEQRSPVKQLMVTMTDQDFAFPVLTRLAREQKWTLLDPESGQRLRFG
jgi:hypothetical protein